MRASPRITSRVGEPWMPILCSAFPKDTPGSSRSTMNALTPFERSSGSRVANTT